MNSTRLEAPYESVDGQTPLDPDETGGLRLTISTRGELNDAEELNIQEGVRWGERRIRSIDPLDVVFARALHRRMVHRVWRWAGTFRMTAKNIGIDAVHINMAAQQLMENASHWIEHRVFQSDELFARFHHRLVEIHCFPNGNGRHARALTDLAMQRHGLSRFTWGASLGNDISRTQYIEALRAADGGDFALLLQFVRR
jgi:Fic-DOC domain mobile mystery protein B